MQELVSIIIPTYNRAHLIGQTLDSVLAQTYKYWECIVVNDGSTDYTDELLEFYVKKDTRIRYYHRPLDRPKGANACRNFGFEVSKGQYINWFDSDDLMMQIKIEEQLKILKTNMSFSFCTCEYGLYDEDFKLIAKMGYKTSNLLEDYILGKAYFNLPTTVFRKTSLFDKPLNEAIYKAQEMEFFFRYLQQEGISYTLMDQELLKVRLHDQNITKSFYLGNKKAISSEMAVRLEGLQILKTMSTRKKINIALSNYMKFLKAILIQKEMYLYYYYLINLTKVLPLREYHKLLKLAIIGMIYGFTNKGLYRFRRDFDFRH
ncbi:glycosyltransferase family 2 protein [Flavimarina sp. Hel_I_48]|uniref:glycosyltransferase family 2 protein n=1 Tax=Flavimarina sp. Hel_I_48 TaxID=1392488 RepID=UPI00068A1D76|nr:glycosyltransferase family 2 protein [Flavimarina sp. Hel_I_48]